MTDRLAEALWAALKHPRGRGGLFRDVFKPEVAHEIEKAGTVIERKRPTITRRPRRLEMTEAWKRARLRTAFMTESGPHGDEFMYELATDLGFAGRPHKLPEVELQRRIEEGDLELWRGVTDASYARDFTDGGYFAGKGFRANGTYVAADGQARSTAGSYARAAPARGIMGKADEPVVMHMALMREAKVIDYTEIKQQAKEEARRTRAQADDAALDSRTREEARRHFYLAADPGRYAMSQGYDAIRVSGQEYVILNRTAVLVSEEFTAAGTNVAKRMRTAAAA